MARDRHPELLALPRDEEGLAALSTRRLAAELGVSGPSLYNHFATKEAILDAVADTVVTQVDLSMFSDGRDWRTALLAWGRSYRAALTDHPQIVPCLAIGPGLRPVGPRMADAVFGGMVDAGWPPAQATRIGALMRYFIPHSAPSPAASSATRRRTIRPTIPTSDRRTCSPNSSSRSTKAPSRPACGPSSTGWTCNTRG